MTLQPSTGARSYRLQALRISLLPHRIPPHQIWYFSFLSVDFRPEGENQPTEKMKSVVSVNPHI